MKSISQVSLSALVVVATTLSAQARDEAKWRPAVDPKPLTEQVNKGLAWIIEHQNGDGGWNQGEESRHMRSASQTPSEPSNVGDTCISVLALVRSGSTASSGDYAKAIRRGVDFVAGKVEAADNDSLWVTDQRGTRLQSKLGNYIDTFMASLMLAEVKDSMPDDAATTRVSNALAKVMRKIETNQRDDGSFGGAGWANALSQSIAGKGYNRAVQSGMDGDDGVRRRLESNAASKYDANSGQFAATDAAGVDLYASASTLGSLQESDNSNQGAKEEIRKQAASAPTAEGRTEAEKKLKDIEVNEKNLRDVRQAVVAKMNDAGFTSGFGSNGGEEFLSYMNIGESLVVNGGPEWESWNKNIMANLNRIQNNDGSWTGHHCITGRNFCTAAALLVLMTDRAPVPMSASLSRR